MQNRVFFAAVFLTLLVFAHAHSEEEEEETILNRVQDYVQHAARQAQEALTNVKDLDMAQQAKGWMTDGFSSLQGYWNIWTDKLTGLWDSADKMPVQEDP
ncbi:apolipoprotein C-III isoform X2 [Macrotis lagotis]